MSSTVSMKLRAKMVERVFLEPPADLVALYVALTWDVAPSNAYGLMLGEPVFGGYARVAIELGPVWWQSTGYGEVLNRHTVTFPMATLDWGLLQGWALTDDPATGAGDTYAVGNLQTPFYCRAGNVPTVAVSGIAVGIYD